MDVCMYTVDLSVIVVFLEWAIVKEEGEEAEEEEEVLVVFFVAGLVTCHLSLVTSPSLSTAHAKPSQA